jgi:hypothetical protein
MKKILLGLVLLLILPCICLAQMGTGPFGDVSGVASVGDCTGGACLDGTIDGGTSISLYDGDSNKATITSPNIASDTAFTLPAVSGALAPLDSPVFTTLIKTPAITGDSVSGLTIDSDADDDTDVTMPAGGGIIISGQGTGYTIKDTTTDVYVDLSDDNKAYIGDNGITLDIDFSGSNSAISSSSGYLGLNGEIYGDEFSTQKTYEMAGDIFNSMTQQKLLLLWLTPSDNGTEIDYSGNGHNATYVDSSDWTSSDLLYQGFVHVLDFDGVNDYLTIADHNDFSFGDGSADSAFSLGGWYYFHANDAEGQSLLSKKSPAAGSEWWLYYTVNHTLTFILYDYSVPATTQQISNAVMPEGWHFVVATYDGSEANTGIKLYVDGAVIASTGSDNGSYVAMENLDHVVCVGIKNPTEQNEFTKQMGYQFITAEELSSITVWELYTSTRGYYNQ